MDEERQREFREGPFSHLPYVGGELVRTAVRIIKVGRLESLTRYHGTDASACSTACTTALNSQHGTKAASSSWATPRTPQAPYVSPSLPHPAKEMLTADWRTI